MPRPVSGVAVSVPVRSSWLESSKMLSVSTCCDSGGCGAMLEERGVALAGQQDCRRAASGRPRSVPPSTASGPRMPLSRCGRLRERLQVLAARREREARIGDERDVDRRVPVRRRERDDGGPLRDGERARCRCRRQRRRDALS